MIIHLAGNLTGEPKILKALLDPGDSLRGIEMSDLQLIDICTGSFSKNDLGSLAIARHARIHHAVIISAPLAPDTPCVEDIWFGCPGLAATQELDPDPDRSPDRDELMLRACRLLYRTQPTRGDYKHIAFQEQLRASPLQS